MLFRDGHVGLVLGSELNLVRHSLYLNLCDMGFGWYVSLRVYEYTYLVALTGSVFLDDCGRFGVVFSFFRSMVR